MPLREKMAFNPIDLIAPETGRKGWEMNRNVGAFLCQGQPIAPKVRALVNLITTRPDEFGKCIDLDLFNRYAAISGSLSDESTAEYNAIIMKFRENLAKLDPQFAAMGGPKVAELVMDGSDFGPVEQAIRAVIAFSNEGRTQKTLDAQQTLDAQESLREVEMCIAAKMDLGANASLFETKKTNRLQSAINYFAAQKNQAMIDEMIALNCPYRPKVSAGTGQRRDPNSRNIDYVFLIALVFRNMKGPVTPALARAFLGQVAKLGTTQLPVSYTGCPGAIIPAGKDPRSVPPHSLTSNRLFNALRIVVDSTNIPEDVMKVGCSPVVIYAISLVIIDIAKQDKNRNVMFEFSRYLRATLLDKIGVECVNFVATDPFKLTIMAGVPEVKRPTGNPQPPPPPQPQGGGGGDPNGAAGGAGAPQGGVPAGGEKVINFVYDANGTKLVSKEQLTQAFVEVKPSKTKPQVFLNVQDVPKGVAAVLWEGGAIKFNNKDAHGDGMRWASDKEMSAFKAAYETDG